MGRERSMYDMNPFKLIETHFMTQNMVYLNKWSILTMYILLLLNGVFYKCPLGHIG